MSLSYMRTQLYEQGIPKVPLRVAKIFADTLLSIPGIIHKFRPKGSHEMDFEDCSATAILYGMRRAQNISTRKPDSENWPRTKWEMQIKSAFKVGVLEGIHRLIYPLRLPRPLRLSIKKYLTLLEFLEPYVGGIDYIEGSRLYKAVFQEGCPILCEDTSTCALGYESCALPASMSKRTRQKIYTFVRNGKGSLSLYAEDYRKTLPEWMSLIQEYRKVTLQTVKVPDIVLEEPAVDIEAHIVLNEFRKKLEEIDPRLFNLYCLSFSEVNVGDFLETNTLFFPKAWASKTLREKYPEMEYEECKELLKKGDVVLNEFRRKYGNSKFPDLQRIISS